MKCRECEHWDSENSACGIEPSELENTVCLLRNIAWVVNEMYFEGDDYDRGF